MCGLIALLAIAYLVGIGVTLAPTIKANWSAVTASQFTEKLAAELPKALAWPATAYRSISGTAAAPDTPNAAEKPAAAN
jgi:Flp pilus assembly pilin Flp